MVKKIKAIYYDDRYDKNIFIISNNDEKNIKKYDEESYKIGEEIHKYKDKYNIKNKSTLTLSNNGSFFISLKTSKKMKENKIIKELQRFKLYELEISAKVINREYLIIELLGIEKIDKEIDEIIEIV